MGFLGGESCSCVFNFLLVGLLEGAVVLEGSLLGLLRCCCCLKYLHSLTQLLRVFIEPLHRSNLSQAEAITAGLSRPGVCKALLKSLQKDYEMNNIWLNKYIFLFFLKNN